MVKINLGMMNCFAVKRWPESEVWCKIIGKDLNLRYAQFSFDLLDPRTIEPAKTIMCKEIIKGCKKYNIHLTSAFTGLASYSFNLLLHPEFGMRMDALNWYEEAVKTGALMEADGVGGHIGALSMRDFENTTKKEYLMDSLMEALVHLSFLGKQKGLKFLLWEPMPVPREAPCTIDEAKRLYELANRNTQIPIKFCLDLGHQCTYSIRGKDRDTYAWLKELAPFSPVIHIQQTDGKMDRHWPFTKEYNKVGIIDPPRIIEAIEDSGAKETTLLFEIIHAPETNENKVLEDLKESVEYWRKYLK